MAEKGEKIRKSLEGLDKDKVDPALVNVELGSGDEYAHTNLKGPDDQDVFKKTF